MPGLNRSLDHAADLLGRMDLSSDEALHAGRDRLRMLLQALGLPATELDQLMTGCASLLRRLRAAGAHEVDLGLSGATLWLGVAGVPCEAIRAGLLVPVRAAQGWRFEALLRDAQPAERAKLVEIVTRRSRAELIDDLQRHQAGLERDIARRTEALSASEQRARTVVEGAPLAVILIDADGRVTEWNRVAEETFGRTAAAAVGQPLQALIDLQGDSVLPTMLARPLDEVARYRTIGRFWDLSARRGDGSRVLVEAGMTVFYTGADWHGTLFLRDSSERKMAENALQAAKATAESAAAMKANFLANMSHEIRTPMNAILGMSHLALRTDLSPRQRDYVAKIQQSGQHLLGIINDILDFSKIEADKLVVERTEFELERVLETVSNLVAEKAAEKGLELVFDIGRDVPTHMVGDPLRLGQILTNYANNAVKFTESGEIDVLVRLRERSDDGVLVYFAVKDSGIGLSEEQSARLFQSFQQADTSTTRKYGGTGLGLAICKKLAELMGGEVGVQSRPGVGSTFWFTSRLGLGHAPERRRLPAPTLRGTHVLVVDDNDSARTVMCELLTAMRFVVHEVPSGPEALVAVESAARADRPYTMVYLDWQMPGMDGFETALRIRQLALAAPPRIVMVTAFGRDELLRQAEQHGIGDVLMKPVSASTLFNTTMRVLGNEGDAPVPVQDQGSQAMLAPLRGARVLLVEDNVLNQEVAGALLGEVGMRVDLAEHGGLALAMVQRERYDLVLMDMQMPVMDGVEATRAILDLPGFKSPPIVAMTANAMQADRDRCMQAGMCDFVSKPIEPEELWRVLLQWIVRRPAMAEPAVPVTAPAPQAASTPADLPAIAGLDQAAGLRRVLGRRELYQSLLRKFVEGQQPVPERVRAALAQDAHTVAERLAHTLKGVAGNIGATAVQADAAALETALRTHQPAASVALALEQVALRLGTLCAALRPALAMDRPAGMDGNEAPPVDPAQLREACEHMRYLLVSDSAEVLELLARHEPMLRRAFATQMDALAAAVNGYDFGEALTLLDQAMRRLEPA